MKRMGHRPRIDTNAPQPGEPWQNRRCSAVVVIVVLVVTSSTSSTCSSSSSSSSASQVHCLLWTSLHSGLAPDQPVRMVMAAEDLFWLVRTGAPAHLYPWWTRLHDQDCPISEPFDARNLLVGAASGLLAQTAEHTVGFLICR